MAFRRKMVSKYTPEEKEYIKKRIISYIESGFSESYSFRQLRIADSTYKKLFNKDKDITNAILKNIRGPYILELYVPEKD